MEFWKKKKEATSQPTYIACQLGDSKECDSVSKIRDYQQKIKEIENKDVREIIRDSFKINENQYHYRGYDGYDTMHLIYDFYSSCNGKINFEEHFKNFGKELDACFDRSNKLKELNEKLKQEKQKLGIQ